MAPELVAESLTTPLMAGGERHDHEGHPDSARLDGGCRVADRRLTQDSGDD